jgi:hypothetical protein
MGSAASNTSVRSGEHVHDHVRQLRRGNTGYTYGGPSDARCFERIREVRAAGYFHVQPQHAFPAEPHESRFLSLTHAHAPHVAWPARA